MPPLPNIRHEAFVQQLVLIPKTRKSQRACYLDAGYQCLPKTADEGASRLARNRKVLSRMEELQRPAARKVTRTLQNLIDRASEIEARAMAAGNMGTALQALALQMKVKLDVADTGDAWAGASTAEELIQRVRDQLGDDWADRLLWMMTADARLKLPAPVPATGDSEGGD